MNDGMNWDAQAGRFQKTARSEDAYADSLMAYLREKGAVRPGYRVADIGCGAGKYALRFAKEGCRLLLLDISGAMMDFALQNLSEIGAEAESVLCDFSAEDIKTRGWEDRVELVFAAMTPAVGTEEDVRKLCVMTTRYGFISRFAGYDDPLQDAVSEACGSVTRRFGGGTPGCDEVMGWLTTMGYSPEQRIIDYGWENKLTVDDAVRRFTDFADAPADEALCAAIKRAMAPFTDENEIVTESVSAKAAWVFWDVTK